MTFMCRLIGFAGAKRAGKDVLAAHFVEHHGYTKYALAGPLKDLCKQLFNFTDAQMEETSKDITDARFGKSPREILQIVGTDCIRNISPDHFVKQLATVVTEHPEAKYVVSDVRFQNEVDAIRALGGKVYLVTRECCTSCDRHVSEQAHLLAVDGVLRNEGTKEHLCRQAERLALGAHKCNQNNDGVRDAAAQG